MPHNIQWYGWIPDHPDQRDLRFRVAPHILKALPPRVDLRGRNMPPVYDQRNLGSCTANAVCAAFQYNQLQDIDVPDWPCMPSRLFQYYNTRILEGTVNSDSGASIRNSIKSAVIYGEVPANVWPYILKKFTQKPPQKVYDMAVKHKAIEYQRLNQTLADIKGAVALGSPVVFGFSVYTAFEGELVAKTGVLNLPTSSETMVGGHAVLIVGYDDYSMRFIVRNSWGDDWGMAGYFTMPYA